MARRFCTMPKDPFGFRDWFESKFGDLCEIHDKAYKKGYNYGGCKLCSDFRFITGIAERGNPFLAFWVLFAVQMPWLWWKWIRYTYRGVYDKKNNSKKTKK